MISMTNCNRNTERVNKRDRDSRSKGKVGAANRPTTQFSKAKGRAVSLDARGSRTSQPQTSTDGTYCIISGRCNSISANGLLYHRQKADFVPDPVPFPF